MASVPAVRPLVEQAFYEVTDRLSAWFASDDDGDAWEPFLSARATAAWPAPRLELPAAPRTSALGAQAC